MGIITEVLDNKITVEFSHNKILYYRREFTIDGKLSNYLPIVLFYNEEEFNDKYNSYPEININITIDSDKFDVFKELIRIRNL